MIPEVCSYVKKRGFRRSPAGPDSVAAAATAAAVVVIAAAAAAKTAAAPAEEQDDQDDDPYTVIAVVAEHGRFLSPRFQNTLPPCGTGGAFSCCPSGGAPPFRPSYAAAFAAVTFPLDPGGS